MCESSVISGFSRTPYDEENIMKTFERETIKAVGQEKWDEITRGITIPTDDMETEKVNNAMREFVGRYDEKVDPHVTHDIFCRVRHGLKRSDFMWARESFLRYRDIDKFLEVMRRETVESFVKSAKDGSYFHGQPVDESVVRFVIDHPYILIGIREENKIIIDAIPQETIKYLYEEDERKKRYYACHCQFAKQSILQEGGPVPKSLCSCSLGHSMVFWEAALDAELTGEVEKSVLGGDLMCRFIIQLPDEVMLKYCSTQ